MTFFCLPEIKFEDVRRRLQQPFDDGLQEESSRTRRPSDEKRSRPRPSLSSHGGLSKGQAKRPQRSCRSGEITFKVQKIVAQNFK